MTALQQPEEHVHWQSSVKNLKLARNPKLSLANKIEWLLLFPENHVRKEVFPGIWT